MNDETRGWKPYEGESVEGRVAELDRGWSDYQRSYYPILTLKREDGSFINVHCFHTALQNRLRAIRPEIGDRLKITYEGKKPSKDGQREISIYKVEAPDRKQDAAAFWDRDEEAATVPAMATPEPDIPADDEELPF